MSKESRLRPLGHRHVSFLWYGCLCYKEADFLGQQGGGWGVGGADGQQANEGGGIDSASSRVWGRARPLVSGSRTASTPTTVKNIYL
jgi:hypothetical protein